VTNAATSPATRQTRATSPAAAVRLDWLDGIKGISILWIVFFHGVNFGPNGTNRFPWPLSDGFFATMRASCAPQSWGGEIVCGLETFGVAVTRLGFHAVAVFLVLSGFGLAYSLAKTGEPAGGWLGWYRSRLLRLFPMYWLAHIVYLVSPFQAQYEPIDYRFLLSFLGDRVWPIDMIFFYFNPALWYFGLLLQLYLVFPVLFRLLQKLGITGFLAVAAVVTFGSRYLLLHVIPLSGNYLQGGFFAPRLWEFAFGMALGVLYRRDATQMNCILFSPLALLAGAVVYVLGLYAYDWSYIYVDALTGSGLTVILAHLARATDRIRPLGRALATVGLYSYGLYLLHQPYVLYFGGRAQNLPTAQFVPALAAFVVVLAVVK